MICRIGAVVLTTFFLLAPIASNAQSADIIIEKKTFEMPSYTTVAGETIKSVKIGWEAAGTLNADKSNAIYSLLTTSLAPAMHSASTRPLIRLPVIGMRSSALARRLTPTSTMYFRQIPW
jgi:hypothetical protein